MDTFVKQPADILDYDAKFEKFLPETDYVTSATASVDVVGELAIDAIQFTGLPGGQTVKVWHSAGLDGSKYKVTVLVATFEGRTKEIDYYVRVKEQ